MGHEEEGIEKHLTKNAKECHKIKPKVTGILEGVLVLLHDHLDGHSKIQDKYKSEKFVVVGKHPEPNVSH